MYRYSKRSKDKLATCDQRLQEVFNEVINYVDNTILTGHRTKEEQDKLYPKYSKVKWPNSKHNSLPSKAIDVAPYPIDWKDTERFALFAGFVKGIATSKGIELRWGGDWDSDYEVKDNSFNDLVHFELVD
jgi:hypothetical protein